MTYIIHDPLHPNSSYKLLDRRQKVSDIYVLNRPKGGIGEDITP
jgi:hypothetical protein